MSDQGLITPAAPEPNRTAGEAVAGATPPGATAIAEPTSDASAAPEVEPDLGPLGQPAGGADDPNAAEVPPAIDVQQEGGPQATADDTNEVHPPIEPAPDPSAEPLSAEPTEAISPTPAPTAAAKVVEPHLDIWLSQLARLGGTDILLTAGSAPLLRVDGQLRPLPGASPLNSDDIEAITRSQFPQADDEGGHVPAHAHYSEKLKFHRELDFSFTWRDEAHVRANSFYQRGQCSLALRYIPMRIPTPIELGLPEVLVNLTHSPSGLVLVTGPTGSGKSTSMAALIDSINHTRPCHIVTIEDPIEYMFTNRTAAVSQREVGNDTESFEAALRSVLREDPDVVLVGEMRDLESITACLTVAETGHLVFATLHTNDSGQALDRIIDVFPADRRPQIQVQLAGTLLAVVYQRLLPRRGGGLVAAYEVMVGVPAVRNLVREGKTRQLRNTLVTHRSEGMQTLEHSLTDLVQAGVIDYSTAVEASLHPNDIPKPAPVNAFSPPGGSSNMQLAGAPGGNGSAGPGGVRNVAGRS